MRQRFLWIIALLLLVAADARAEQTIVFLRHGEKPSGGYGQLTCQGFNRALVPIAGSARQSFAPATGNEKPGCREGQPGCVWG